MAWGLDLAELKQLAMNTIKYSSMTDEEKQYTSVFLPNSAHNFILVNQGKLTSD